MNFAAIGALGSMLSPAAGHLQKASFPAKCLAVVDRGNPSRAVAREQWENHGARLVSSVSHLGEFELDFVVVCAGKDGDDKKIFESLSAVKFNVLVHLSTVSAQFADCSKVYWENKGVSYLNCPLTGGPKGAEEGTMLILGSGEKRIFDKLLPFFEAIGVPRFFGEAASAGAEVKLIGQVMVFTSLLGMSTAVQLHGKCFPEDDQTSFFDFLNKGAGGCRQWEVALRQGLSDENWSAGFDIRHAVVDAVYALRLLKSKQFPGYLQESLRTVIELFVLQLKSKPQGTHSILKLLSDNPYSGLDLEEVLAELPSDVFESIDGS